MDDSVSLVIPTYNEKDNISPLVERIHGAMSGRGYNVLFVDDDSKDGTAQAVNDLSSKYPVRVMVRKGKKGLASAVVDGFASTDSTYIVVMDADLQHPPEVIPGLLAQLDKGIDVAVASRYIPGGGCEGWSLTRRVISKGAVIICHLLLPSTRTIKDVTSGYFALNRRVLDGAELKPTGYKILLEVLLEGRVNRTGEVPFIFKTRSLGESKLNARQQVEYLKHIWSLMRRTGEDRRFVKFSLVGGSGIIVNEGLLWLLTQFANMPLLGASAISIESSIISNFILNDIFTFRDRRSSGSQARAGRLLKFNLVSLAGLVINMGVLWLLTNVFGVFYLVSNLIGIAIAFILNYFLNSLWTWRYTQVNEQQGAGKGAAA